MSFDNEKNIACLKLNGEKIILQGQAAASGIWYKNDVYELRVKGQDISLEKDGKLIFKVIFRFNRLTSMCGILKVNFS